ncbi:TIGR02391 family protein [Burkholderia sp. 9775_39]|uniref:TIGR02391 family protein n=1 Tax=unclassified Burkholderia TaxID=2613784 RepID=UPI0018C364D7|nr:MULTISPECIES: TIGR02391 family protein [unclassified Burkholderia]MBG0877413.1 TIGR02391 family protein [Burkholderia sp. 9775_39]MBG0888517.1 TIGR02391 family protein [Burkholderia sp. 9773_38]
MLELTKKFPDAEVLLGLEPEELAMEVLFILKEKPAMPGLYTPDAFFPRLLSSDYSLTQAYPPHLLKDVQLAVMEAISWLVTHGLIVRCPEVKQPSSGAWRLSRRARGFQDRQAFVDHQTAQLLPKQLLHPKLTTNVWLSFMRGDYPTAVFQAMRAVEIAVREAAGYSQSEIGVNLARKAFNKENGPLTDRTTEEGERDALSALFAGAIGSYKNPHSHRNVPIDTPREAIEMIILASHLLGIVDARAVARRAVQ